MIVFGRALLGGGRYSCERADAEFSYREFKLGVNTAPLASVAESNQCEQSREVRLR